MTKHTKWIVGSVAGVLLTPIILFVLLTVALYLPPVQNWAVDTVAKYASEETGMNISVEHVCLVFPLDLGVDGVMVTQQNDSLPQVTDTVADIKRVVADVQLMPLLDSTVEIDRFDIYDMKVNTADFIHQARVKGQLALLSIESHGINLKDESIKLNKAFIDGGQIDVALSDTVPEDTTESENFWKITLDDLTVSKTGVTIHMPGDTMQVMAYMGKANARTGYFDLYKGLYKIDAFDLTDGKINYDVNINPDINVNPNINLNGTRLNLDHIAFSNINIGVDSLMFCAPDLSVNIRNCQMTERCGIRLDTLYGKIRMDSTQVRIHDFEMRTPNSRLSANVDMDLNVMAEKNPGIVSAQVDAQLGKGDILLAMGAMPKAFQNQWPSQPLAIKLDARGNMNYVDIKSLYADLPTAFNITGRGNASLAKELRCKMHIDARTKNLNFVKTMLDSDMQKMINIPAMHAVADINVAGNNYDVAFNVAEGKGSVSGKGKINTATMTYAANIDAKSLQMQDFVRGMGLGGFTGKASVTGSGVDVFSPRTKISASAEVDNFKYDKWNLNNMNLDANVSGGLAHAMLVSHNDLIDGTIGLDALMSSNPLNATLTTELNKADLYNLKITETPFTIAACAHIDVATDKAEYYKVQGLLSDLTIIDTAKVYRPDDMVLDVFTRSDTTHAVVDCGDFHLNADTKGGYKFLMGLGDQIMKEMSRQMDNRIIDDKALRTVLPTGHLYLSAGQENPIARIASRFDCTFANAYMDFTSSPEMGINGEMHIDTLRASGFQLDRIRFNIASDEENMKYIADVENGKDNPQYCFHAIANGYLHNNGTKADLTIFDDKGKKGIFVGLAANMEPEGIRISLDESDQILGYKAFKANDDNYVFLSKDMRVSSDVKLRASDGTGIQLYSDDENAEALQDLTVSLHKFNLKEVMDVIPYTPDMSGVMDGDFHVIITPENMSVSSSVEFQNLTYEKWPMGNISSEFVYMPMEDGTHHIDGLLFKDDNEVGTIIGAYNPEGEGSIDANIGLKDFPLDIANGFIPDQIVGLIGVGEGSVNVKGSLSKPDVNGEVYLQNASLISVPYGVSMKFDDDPVVIENSQLLLENFEMYANNHEPLVVRGKIDFSNLDHIYVDMRMKAENYKIVDAKETRRSEAYGEGYVNFSATMNGELDRLSVRGKLDVLPSTNLFYILRDSPITTDNRLKELVTFTDFKAETPVQVVKPDVDGLNVDFDMNVMEGAHITCWLNTTHSNYLDVIGGGSLKMKYNSGDISVTGRYTISEGEMKYSLPVIPLKTFKITDGSYIEFTGDMMNPRLAIEAAEENKTTVNLDGTNQTVLFNCGVKISKTLQDMGLEFTIDAPENQTISDDLKTKSIEERGKLAVTMLTTGMYLTPDNTSSFTMNSALTSFLQSEINNIAGSALKTLDISVGLDNSTDAQGQMHTDYSFKFAKRFLQNRLSVSIGGKLSTGTYENSDNQNFFDNAEIQYRLSQTSNQYLQAFYKRAVYDYLEGYVGEYGAGYIWKRKLQNFRDIFQFGDKNLKADTLTYQTETRKHKADSLNIEDARRDK